MCEPQSHTCVSYFVELLCTVNWWRHLEEVWANGWGGSAETRVQYILSINKYEYKPMWRDCLWCSPQRSTQSLPRRSLLYEHRTILWYTPTCNFICSRSLVTALTCTCFCEIHKCPYVQMYNAFHADGTTDMASSFINSSTPCSVSH